MTHPVRPHIRNGRPVRGYRKRNPGSRSGIPSGPSGGPVIVAIVAVVCAVVTFGGAWAFRARTGSPPGSQAVSKAFAGRSQTGLKKAEANLRAKSAKVESSIEFDVNCASKSEQELQDHFLSNPCKGLARAYIQIGDNRRNFILVSISWVEMPTSASAKEYESLVFNDVGNIIELSREVKELRTIKYENRIYTSGIEGAYVWQVEVKPVSSTVPEGEVNEILERSRQ